MSRSEVLLKLFPELLSTRAWSGLRRLKIATVGEFLSVSLERLHRTRNVGSKTVEEYRRAQQTLRDWVAEEESPSEESAEVKPQLSQTPLVAEVCDEDSAADRPSNPISPTQFQELALLELPARALRYLNENGIETAEAFLSISRTEVMNTRSMGKGTADAILTLQRKLRGKAENGTEARTEQAAHSQFVDIPELEGLQDWNDYIEKTLGMAIGGRASESAITTLRLRFGLNSGMETPKTYEEVGLELGVSRQRVCQIEQSKRKNVIAFLRKNAGEIQRFVERLANVTREGTFGIVPLSVVIERLQPIYPWLSGKTAIPAFRLFRLSGAAECLGWTQDPMEAGGERFVWWDLPGCNPNEWNEFALLLTNQSRHAIQSWRIEQEKTPAWRFYRILASLRSTEALRSLGLDTRKSCGIEKTLRRLERQFSKRHSTTHVQEWITETLRDQGDALSAQELEEKAKEQGLPYGLNAIRGRLMVMERMGEVLLVGGRRFVLATHVQGLSQDLIHEIVDFLEAQLERGHVRCGFIHQAYHAFRSRLPDGMTKKLFYAYLHNAGTKLFFEAYPGVASVRGLKVKERDSTAFWDELKRRLVPDLPLPKEQLEAIWVHGFGGQVEEMGDRLVKYLCIQGYQRDGRTWYGIAASARDLILSAEERRLCDRASEIIRENYPSGFDFSEMSLQLIFDQGDIKLSERVLEEVRKRMFMRRDGFWFFQEAVCSRERIESLAEQCVELLGVFPIVTKGCLWTEIGNDGNGPIRNPQDWSRFIDAAFRDEKRFAVGDDVLYRKGAAQRDAINSMMECVKTCLQEEGVPVSVEELLERFPNVDAGWLTKSLPRERGRRRQEVVFDDTTGGGGTLACLPELPEGVERAIQGIMENLEAQGTALTLRALADGVNAWYDGDLCADYALSEALFRMLVRNADGRKRKWQGDVFGACQTRNIDDIVKMIEQAPELSRVFSSDAFFEVGHRVRGWTAKAKIPLLWSICMRWDVDVWSTPRFFEEVVGWTEGLAGRVKDVLEREMGGRGFLAFGTMNERQLGGLPQLTDKSGREVRWTRELVESVAFFLLDDVCVLNHAQRDRAVSGLLVPQDTPPEMSAVQFLSRWYVKEKPLDDAQAEDIAAFIIEQGVTARKTEKLLRDIREALKKDKV